MNRIKVFIIATFSAISGLMIGAALGNQVAQVRPSQPMPGPVVMHAWPVPAEARSYVTSVHDLPGLLRMALDARRAQEEAREHGYALAVAAVCDPQCQNLLQALLSTAMAAQSFGVQFIQGDAETVQNLVSQGWIKGPAY